MTIKHLIASLTAVTALAAGAAQAGTITSPTAILQNTAGVFTSGAEVQNAFNGSGLSVGFTSGVTDFDSYIAANPTHTTSFSGKEWFSTSGGIVDLDFGSVLNVTRLAIWNEEGGNGVGSLTVSASADTLFTTLTALGTFAPAQNPEGSAYSAQVFDLTDASTQFLRLEFAPNSGQTLFGLGEIAFDTSSVAAVPVPASLPLMIGALAGVAALRRGRSRRTA